MARDVMMSARSTPNLQQAVPCSRVTSSTVAPESKHHASIYSYLHTQSGLNFAPVVPRQGDSPPPAPPVRDASSLKGVKYGPGHEKFPSWPVSAAADTPAAARSAPGGGSHRSKSWTDHTNYPKEKGLTYTRPYMKRPNPAFTQQLKTVMERCEKIPPETYESRADVLEDSQGRLYLPRLDREGKSLGDMDYLAPSPPERDVEEFKTTPSSLTQADLEEYARAYQPQQQPAYAQSEGYHSYVSSTDSTTTTPFLDRLRRDSEMTSRPVAGPQTAAWDDGPERDGRPGRDSVVTTSSGSASSSETLKWHGSLSDVSVASSSCTQQGGSSSSRQLIAHSARVQTPQRHHSESVLYLGSQARVQRNNHHNKLRLFPVNTYTVQPQEQQQQSHRSQPLSPSSQPALSVAERISELERQQMLQTRYTYLDPDKRHRVSDPTLKAIQKKALLSFYERHHHAGGQARAQQTWRSEPQLAQPIPRPQSPPPPQPPPRPRTGQSARRASSASDYAGGAWREMAANREATAAPESSNMRDSSRHQHSSSCGSLSADLLGPLVIGPSILVDDWVPERPPKKPHLRAAFPPPVPERMPSPDLPPPSPPPMLEDEVFATDEPLPPPPPELHPLDWSMTSAENVSDKRYTAVDNNTADITSQRLVEYTNLPPKSMDAPSSPQRNMENGLSSHRHTLPRNQESHSSSSRHPDSSSLTQRHQENPSSPHKIHSSTQRHPESQPDVVPSGHRHESCNGSSSFRHQESVSHKQDNGLTTQRHGESTKHSEICSTEQNRLENPSNVLQKHSETNSISQRNSDRYNPSSSSRYFENTHHMQRHPETGFTVPRYLENGSTAHQRHLESGHAIHRHLETGIRHSENGHTSHRSDSNQRHLEVASTVHRPGTQRHVENNNHPPSVIQSHNFSHQQHGEKSSEMNNSSRPETNHKIHKREDELMSQQYLDNSSLQNDSMLRHNNIMSQKSFENGLQQKNSQMPISPQREHNNSIQKCVENGVLNPGYLDNNNIGQSENSRYHESRLIDSLNHRYNEGGTLNRRHLESNRSLDGSSAIHRYQENNLQSQKHSERGTALYNPPLSTSISSIYKNTSGMYSRPSGMRSTENLHQKMENSRPLEHWSNLKYSTQKLVVNGKLAAPLGDRTVQNGGFTDSVRMGDLDRISKRNCNSNFSSMPARARLQRLPLVVPNGDVTSHSQLSPKSPQQSGSPRSPTQSQSPIGPRSPSNSQAVSPGSRSPAHNLSLSPVGSKSSTQHAPRSPSQDLVPGSRSPPHAQPTSRQLENSIANLIEDSPTHSQQTTSKASYLASYRRDRDRGLPNFEGSYKRIMSPTGQEDNPVPECDRLSVPEAPSIPAEELHSASQHQAVNPEKRSPSAEAINTRTKEDVVVVERLESVVSSSSELSLVKDCEPSGGLLCAAPPVSVEIETQCDLTETVTTQQQQQNDSGVAEDSPPDSPPPSPPVSPPATPPAPSPSPPPASPVPRRSPKVTESLQLVQRSEVVLRVNAATSDAASQTEVEKESIATAMLVRPKLQEEIECERLSLDLASQLPPSDKLQTLLVPDPEHKKPTDYVSGLFRLDVALRPRPAVFRTQVSSNSSSSNNTNAPTSISNGQAQPEEGNNKENNSNSPVSPLPANSKYFTISESKAKFLNRYVRDMGQLNGLHDNKDLHQKKEELMSRLARKLEVLRGEQLVVTEEATVNEQLGESVAAHVSRLARPHELGKYRLHVEEVGKITSLLLGLSGRLARAENALMGLPMHHSERKILESKRDKLREQLEEAKKLKENIDRRSVSVSNILYKYFNSEEYADYDHFINMKAKLIMDCREIADKIKLGEEQLAALKETLCSSPD